ncbi:MAG: hypothetical protein GY909_14105 [Oligoflexia bacterium]|nr:hypothetical protein [Oligoflexia bacterium]
MSFSSILKLKKANDEEHQEKYIQHLVVGSDIFSMAIFLDLVKKHGEEKVALLHEFPLTKKHVSLIGPSMLRGGKNIELFKTTLPHVDVVERNEKSLFFKEGKWREFGGRSKPEKLLFNEEFYTLARGDVNYAQLFPFLESDEAFSCVEKNRIDSQIKSVCKTESTDLVEPNNFKVECLNKTTVNCEKLYWGKGPKEFLSKYDKKNELSDQFIEFCESTDAPATLFIHLTFDKKVTDQRETLFIPLSYTHDHGHFIGEFGQEDNENGKQVAQFITHIDPHQCNEEDVSRKIRLLKRNLEKIYPETKKISYSEYLRLSDYSPCLNVDDEKYSSTSNELPHLEMVSFNAPVNDSAPIEFSFEDSENSVGFLARASKRWNELGLN